MKKLIALLLATMMTLSLAACGNSTAETKSTADAQSSAETQSSEPSSTSAESSAVSSAPEEAAPNYAEILPDKLQGVWCDSTMAASDGILTLYAFDGNKTEIFVINSGNGSGNLMSGTYTVEDGQISYNFGKTNGFSTFSYENENLALFNANGIEIKKLSAADIMEYLTQEESSSNTDGVVCLADLILIYYPDSDECSAAAEKKDVANAAVAAAGEAALANLRTEYDQVQKITWYLHKDRPEYVDTTCYIYPYIGRSDNGNTWLRVELNYTDAQTDAGWIFFNHVIFSVDGDNTTKTFSRSDITRDNDTEVWETADFEPNDSEIKLLEKIANSDQTIIRFEGDEYYEDHVVTATEKAAILDVLTAYNYLKNS